MSESQSSEARPEKGPPDAGQNGPAEPRAFPVVGVGASAGGLEAFSQLLAHLPENCGMGLVLVQHLDPKHSSSLADILKRSTRMPVLEGEHGMAVRSNHVYVIPPNSTMTVSSGLLQLAPRGESRLAHLPVDQFFRSLAQDRQTGAIGVILSGNGSDGTLGVEEIKAAGGITFAQDEQSARYAGMPHSALRSGCIDFVLPPDAIARELSRMAQHPYLVPAPAREGAPPSDEGEQFNKILSLLRASFNVDFSVYRDTTIRRRIMRRMVLHTKENLGEYVQLLEKDRPELEALYQDILINVTSFFREPETFEALKKTVFPEIVKANNQSGPLRIWVPGCSTGQEAYSLAMVLLEYVEEKALRTPLQIFATDLSDTVSLQRAREGIYPENIEAEVSPERLRRFFTKEDAKYRVNKAIRELCLFAKQNVAADPPFSRLDLISCRNLLIYLGTPLQKRIIPTFHYALNPNGYLVLGASETIGSFTDLFGAIDPKHRIYVKKASSLRPYPHFDAEAFRPGAAETHKLSPPSPAPQDWQREADRLVLSQYAPAGVLVNDNLDVLHFRGQTGAYLVPAPGEASFNLLRMAREGLFLALRDALHESRQAHAEVRRQSVRVRSDGDIREINLRVLPVKLAGAGDCCFLILFEELATAGRPQTGGIAGAGVQGPEEGSTPAGPGLRSRGWRGWWQSWLTPTSKVAAPAPVSEADDQEAQRLRQELTSTREYLQSIIEQQDAFTEELKSAHEEVLSSNEELQSTNEELETAKEELQSVNEELTTINEQLQNRNVDLSRLNDDITNLLSSANVPMVSVGADLRIRRFTPSAGKLLNLLPSDVGRPISNLRPAVDVADLEALIAEVIDTVQPREREVHDPDGRWYALRVYPYRTADNKIDGAVVVLVDIDHVKSQAARLLQQASLIDLSQDAICVRDGNGVITFWNKGAREMYGWSHEEARGKVCHTLLQTTLPDGTALDLEGLLRQTDHWEGELMQTRRDGGRIVVESRQVLKRDEQGAVAAVLEIDREITQRKQMQEDIAAMRQAVAEKTQAGRAG